MTWGLNAKGADDLADRLAGLRELPFLDEALRASLDAARERLGAPDEVEVLVADEGHVLRVRADPFTADEFGTVHQPARPTLGPALRDSRRGLLSTVHESLRAGLRRARGGAA